MSKKPSVPIVSSHELAAQNPELSEFEFGLLLASHAFTRWTARCMKAAGFPELSSLDVLVLHTVNHRKRSKRLSDICFVLNIEEPHTVNYSLKKLIKCNLVEKSTESKEKIYTITSKGEDACVQYATVRERCLLESLASVHVSSQKLDTLADVLRTLSGLYDQAARSASSI